MTSAEGKYKGAEAQVNYSEIRSPIDGVVTDRPLFAGETAAAGAPLITVMDTSALLAKTHIAQSLAQQMKVGDEASVHVPGVADPVPAKVSLISPALDPGSTTVEVWLQDRQQGRHAEGGHAGEGHHHRQDRCAGVEDSRLRGSDRAGRQQIRDGGRQRRRGAPQARDAGHRRRRRRAGDSAA